MKSHFEIASNDKNYDLAQKLLERLAQRIPTYAEGFHLELGLKEVKELRAVIERSISRDFSSLDNAKKKALIQLCDTWAGLGGNLCLEALRRLLTFEKELTSFFDADKWTAKAMQQLPAFLQTDVAFIARWTQFELDIEGSRLSQPKYLQQIVVQKLLTKYSRIIPEACEFYQKQVPEFANNLIKSGFTEAATQVLLSNLHSYWKIPKWLEAIGELLVRYESYAHYPEQQYQLGNIGIEAFATSLVSSRNDVISLIAGPDIFGYLADYTHDEDLPDQFGHTYYLLAEECIHALQENNLERFRNVLRVFIPLALIADAKFSQPDHKVAIEHQLHLISTVVQDLASVIGFAILESEYHCNPALAATGKACFWSYADKVEDKSAYLTRLLRLSDTRIFSWAALPRDAIRMEWRMAFERRARADGYLDQFGYDDGTEHPSSIVNEFLSSRASASDLFFAVEILPMLGKVDFKIDRRILHLAKKLSKYPPNEEEVDENP